MRKYLSVILTCILFAVMLSVGTFATDKTNEYRVSGKTTPASIKDGCVINENGEHITVSFFEKNGDMFVVEEAENNASFAKNYTLDITFYGEDNSVIETVKNGFSVNNNSSLASEGTRLSIPVKHYARTFSVSYAVFGEIPVEYVPTKEDIIREERAKLPWYIERDSIKVRVTETNEIICSETIDAVFNKDGIGKIVKIIGNSGADTSDNVKMQSVTCDGKDHFYTLKHKDGYHYTLPVNTANNRHTFNFVYIYTMPKDTLPDCDALRCVLLNGGWDAPIEAFDYSIELPKNSALLADKGFNISGGASASLTDNLITGSAENLKSGASVAFDARLENGYFAVNESSKGLSPSVMCGVAVVVLMFLYVMYQKHQTEQDIGDVVPEYDCPEKPAYKLDYSHNCSVAAGLAVLPLQEEEYIGIEKSPVTGGYILTKKKEYAGGDSFVKHFIDTVFGEQTEADTDDIKENFTRSEYMAALKIAENDEDCKGLFAKAYQRSSFIKNILSVFVLSLLAAAPFVVDHFNPITAIAVFFITLLLLPLHYIISSPFVVSLPIRSVLTFVAAAINIAVSSTAVMAVFHIKDISTLATQIGVLVMLYIGLYVISLLAPNNIERTVKGLRVEAEVEAHRSFIMAVTPSQAESITANNSGYFAGMLPYAFIFGENAAENFTDKFKDAALHPVYEQGMSAGEIFEFSRGLYVSLYGHFSSIAEKRRR